MESLQGKLLISSGGLYDPNFRHTVVLIGVHDHEGAVGVVLSRALEVTVDEAVPELAELVPAGDMVYEGGPVEPQQPVLIAEVSRPEILDIFVFQNVGFLVGDVTAEVQPAVLRARVFAGHAGWAPGQLEAEMAEDAWIVEPALVDDVFDDDPETLWRRVLERKGPDYRTMSKMPFDPSMN